MYDYILNKNNAECDAMVDMTLNDLQIKVKVIVIRFEPIDSSYTTSYRLSIVTFAVGLAVQPQYITLQTTDRRTQHCSISATVSTVG